MAIEIFHVDAFAHQPFNGNPACVCLLEREADPEWMQNFAAEMNLSETAFVRATGDEFELRWFTPKAEVALCGHATLASAHVLWDISRVLPDQEIRFSTRSGILSVTKKGPIIDMDFPADSVEHVKSQAGLLEALSIDRAEFLGRGKFDFLVVVESESIVRGLNVDFAKLKKFQTRGIAVTAKSETPGVDFVSRFFAPAVGIDEDPVTGSAHTMLGPFWGERLAKEHLVGFQASPRGGIVNVQLRGDRVGLGGQAVTISRGVLL